MSPISFIPLTETGSPTANTNTVQLKWILSITSNDDAMARQILDEVPAEVRSRKLLGVRLVFPGPSSGLRQRMKRLTSTTYSPDRPWSLAAVCDSRAIMKVLLEYGADALQVNSHRNNMLHVLAALASTANADKESEVVETARHIRSILKPEFYKKLLLAENADGLRPMELASHLGAFNLFEFYFDTPDLYISREEDLILYKIQHFDITEYVTGARYYQSPLNGMLHVEEDRISSISVHDIYLKDPMRSWLDAIYYVNVPVIVIWAIFRITYISLVLSCDMTISEACTGNSSCADSYADTVTTKLDLFWILLILSMFIIAIDAIDLIWYLFYRPRWLNRVVYGRKKTGMHQTFYRMVHFLSAFTIAIVTMVSLHEYHQNRPSTNMGGYGVVAAVYGFVWSILYFLQMLPVIGHYVMAVQRMLKDFANFGILFLLFFLSYSIGFFNLLKTYRDMPDFSTFWDSLYGTFSVMLNTIDFRDVSGNLKTDVRLLHITFVFMIATLLMNFLIATLSSSYEHVMKCGKIFILMQMLSVAMAADRRFQVVLPQLRNYLLRRHFVHQNGRYFISRVTDIKRTND